MSCLARAIPAVRADAAANARARTGARRRMCGGPPSGTAPAALGGAPAGVAGARGAGASRGRLDVPSRECNAPLPAPRSRRGNPAVSTRNGATAPQADAVGQDAYNKAMAEYSTVSYTHLRAHET